MRGFITFIIAGIVLVVAALVAFYLFLAVLVIGVALFGYASLRRFLARKKVLPEDAFSAAVDEALRDAEPDITVIEGEFVEVQSQARKESSLPPQ